MRKDSIIDRLQEIIDVGHWQTQSDFCESVGISPQILCNTKNASMEREVPKSLLIGLARLNYNITWFLYGHGPMKNYSSTEDEVLSLRKQIDALKRLKDVLDIAELEEQANEPVFKENVQ